MSISFQAKSSPVLSRQLEAQEIVAECNLTASDAGLKAASSDSPSIVSISGALATRTITLDVGEEISKCFFAEVRNRATGAVVALSAAPDISTSKKISVTVDGTGLSSVCVKFCYKVAE
jgi:hypothetical protein